MGLFWKSKDGKLSPGTSHTSSTETPASATSSTISSQTPLQENGPICQLPIELIQQIASYLEAQSASSFCLSNRYICYAVGRDQLYKFLHLSSTKFIRRKNIEILERAFPSHWYCAWCDKFHQYEKDGGPKRIGNETKRDCAEFNSYLHAGKEYVITFHHVRLAVNRVIWGNEYGMGAEDFGFKKVGSVKIGKGQMPMSLEIRAKIVDGKFFLHSNWDIVIPRSNIQKRELVGKLLANLPQVVGGHRNDHEGHTGLHTSVGHALERNWKYQMQLCSTCATDYLISTRLYIPDEVTNVEEVKATAPIELRIQSWRDLSSGRNPFEASWRAHGEIGNCVPGFGGDVVRLTNLKAGQIREAFERDTQLKSTTTLGEYGVKPPPGLPRRKSCEDKLNSSWTQEIITSGPSRREQQRQESERLEEEEHNRRVLQNNTRLIAEGPPQGFTTPYGMSWTDFVYYGGMRGRDGIPLSDIERSQLTSGRGMLGG